MDEIQIKAIEAAMDKAMRNIFAAVALHALLPRLEESHSHQAVAKTAFNVADAMMEEMSRRTTSTSPPNQ
jgi:hypothetical protein